MTISSNVFILWFCAVWPISALISAGWLFAYFQKRFVSIADDNWREDLGFAIGCGFVSGILGPVGILIIWLNTGFAKHGWSLWRRIRK